MLASLLRPDSCVLGQATWARRCYPLPASQAMLHRLDSVGFCSRVGTQNKSLSRRVPLQRSAAQGKDVRCLMHLQEHVIRMPPVVCQAPALQAALRLLSC